ncbi:hypothetical protein CHS0354_026422 [Potamilus streckersoni]|uniref:Uncharacterized protein n=1 Tax=Potamilus streckersoni TaxID=2493646 RepID=A0AAE0T301_9BIVA|nr:hypothetical protein CHS0354_026422 [Potamilus streckersoni]
MDHRMINRMDFIQKCSDNKLHDFTVQDLNEIFIDFNHMYNILQKSKQEQFSVFEFQAFIQYLRNKNFTSAKNSLDGALREYKLVYTLLDRLEKKHDETNDHWRQRSHISVERNTDRSERQSVSYDGRKSVSKTYIESRYSPQSEVKTGGIVCSDDKGNLSQNVNLEESNEQGLSETAALTEKDRNNSDVSLKNTERLSNNYEEKGKENYKSLYSWYDSNNITFIPTEKTDEVSRFSDSKLSSRSKDLSIKEADQGENNINHRDLKESYHKGDGFGTENSPGSVTQNITEHGHSNGPGAAPGPGINDNKRSQESPGFIDSRRYKY